MSMELAARRLMGRRAIVTGGGSGIGRACALRLAGEGAAVGVLDVRAAAAAEVVTQITADGGTAIALAGDITDEAAVIRAVAEAVDRFGGLDTLAACAGILFSGLLHELSLEDWNMVLRVNLTGTFLAIKHSLPSLCGAGDASIVTIGSVASLVAGGAAPSYDASKGGVLQLTRAVAAEYAAQGVRANCVCPGAVTTNLRTTSNELTGGRSTALSSDVGGQRVQVPMARRADPAEIAAVVAFLCSRDASFMTGAAVPVDGGFTAV